MAKFCTQTRNDHIYAGHVLGFMSIWVVFTKIMTFVYKMRACRPSPAQPSRLAGWLQQRKACALLLIAQALQLRRLIQ